jgi:hypothetical protein
MLRRSDIIRTSLLLDIRTFVLYNHNVIFEDAECSLQREDAVCSSRYQKCLVIARSGFERSESDEAISFFSITMYSTIGFLVE